MGGILSSGTLQRRMGPIARPGGCTRTASTGRRAYMDSERMAILLVPTALVLTKWVTSPLRSFESLAGGTFMGATDRATSEVKMRGYGWNLKRVRFRMCCRRRVPTHLQLTRQQRLNAAARPRPWRSCSRIRRGSSERGRTIPRSDLGQSAGDGAATSCRETVIFTARSTSYAREHGRHSHPARSSNP